MSDLTLPGDIPGLLRRGSTVLAFRYAGETPAICLGATYTPDGNIGDWVHIVVNGHADAHPARSVALDLTDATGRAHAAQWLGSQRGLSGGMAADLRRSIGSGIVLSVWAPGWSSAVWTPADVPALAGLDPNDTRMLPDGSRWVDAEALRLVCLHVAGRTP